MADATLRGSCLCSAVRFEIRPPFIRFAHCYCTRCRKATGGVKSSNISVLPTQFSWISGEDVISRWDMPDARAFATAICTKCNCPVPGLTRDGQRFSVPAGTLDDELGDERPSAHRYWDSRAGWAATDESHLPYED